MKIKILKDKRDLRAGTVVEQPASIAAKFIRQGFAEAYAAPKKKTAKKKTVKKKTSTT